MAKKQSCSRCHTLLKSEEHANKLHGAVFCDSHYPGIPPHIGRQNYETHQRIEHDKAFLKRTMPGMAKEIDEMFGGNK